MEEKFSLVTNKRLLKFVYTTPFTKHVLSLNLDMIVDTGSYAKGFMQAVFKLGTFTARSSAASSGVATDDIDRINKKYFYIENVHHHEDLQQYINKVLAHAGQPDKDLATFRPFIAEMKAQLRRDLVEKQYPQYWS